jgi:hypothetical protein
MADFSAPTDWSRSFSSALNSASCFSRIAVALSRASWFFAISPSRFLISVLRRELCAVFSSIVEVRSVMRASAS